MWFGWEYPYSQFQGQALVGFYPTATCGCSRIKHNTIRVNNMQGGVCWISRLQKLGCFLAWCEIWNYGGHFSMRFWSCQGATKWDLRMTPHHKKQKREIERKNGFLKTLILVLLSASQTQGSQPKHPSPVPPACQQTSPQPESPRTSLFWHLLHLWWLIQCLSTLLDLKFLEGGDCNCFVNFAPAL